MLRWRLRNGQPTADVVIDTTAYGFPEDSETMEDTMVGEDGTVSIESAAELIGVEVRAIRQWSAIGSLQIERRGDVELVHLGHVKALARSPIAFGDRTETPRTGLRGLLREAKAVDAQSVAGLQALARERV
jgi:hypothetical protein